MFSLHGEQRVKGYRSYDCHTCNDFIGLDIIFDEDSMFKDDLNFIDNNFVDGCEQDYTILLFC